MSATSQQKPQVTISVPAGTETIHDTLDQGRYHLILGVSPEMNGILEKLALRYGVDKAHVLNRAVGLLNAFADAVDKGKRVGIATDEQELDTEIMEL